MPYTIHELPPLPGGTYTSAHGINDSGVVVGTGDAPDGTQRALYWIGGAVNEIPTPAGLPFAMATGVNATGAIVGFMTGGSAYHGFLFDGVTVHDLGPGPADESRAYAINDAGEIAGLWRDSTGAEHPVLWTPGLALVDLGGFGFPMENYATAIANAPFVAGTSSHAADVRHAFLWVDGVMNDLGTLGGGRSIARGLLAGAWPDPGFIGVYVVGGSEFPGSGVDRHAFVWHKGDLQDLGTLPGWFASEAHAINSSLQIVGFAAIDPTGVGEHAVLWDSSWAIADLNTLIADPTWETLYVATSINNGGVIAGYGTRGGAPRGFVLEPA